jgi:hypothetical protein
MQGLANYSIKFAKESKSERGWSRNNEGSPGSEPGPVVLEKDKVQHLAIAEAVEVTSGSWASRNAVMPLPA